MHKRHKRSYLLWLIAVAVYAFLYIPLLIVIL